GLGLWRRLLLLLGRFFRGLRGGLRFPAFAFAGIVGDIPPGSLELESGLGDQFRQASSASLVFLEDRIAEFLDDFNCLAALLAGVFVNWHVAFNSTSECDGKMLV